MGLDRIGCWGLACSALVVAAACSDSRRSAAATIDAGEQPMQDGGALGPDGGDELPDAMPPDAWTEEACADAYAALEDECTVDADCTVVVHELCAWQGEGTSPAYAVSTSALEAARQLPSHCPEPFNGCQGEGIAGAPVATDDGSVLPWLIRPSAVCRDGRCASVPSACGTAVCGDGTRDRCTVTADAGLYTFVPAQSNEGDVRAEACEGDDLYGQACDALGYAGGALSCIEGGCVLDASACTVCTETEPAVQACASALWPDIDDVAAAASADEIAVVWTTISGSDLHFARVSSALAVLSEASYDGWLNTLSVARVAQGWLVAGVGSTPAASGWVEAVQLQLFDAGGQHAGEVLSIEGALEPRLAGRSDGPPLLSYTTAEGDRMVTVLSDDLMDHSAPVMLASAAWGPGLTALWHDGAWLVPVATNNELRVHRVEVDGTLASARLDLPSLQFGSVTELDGAPWVVARAANGTMHLIAIDPETMSATGDPIEADAGLDQGGAWREPLGFDDAWVFAVEGAATPAATHAELVRVDAQGEIAERTTIATAPRLRAVSAVRFGEKLLFVFQDHTSVVDGGTDAFAGVARQAPPGLGLALVE